MLAETSGNTRMQEHEVHLNQIVETYSELATLYRKAGDVLNIRLKRVTHAKIPSSV
jgi:acetyl-CoA carboxylase beta subunit